MQNYFITLRNKAAAKPKLMIFVFVILFLISMNSIFPPPKPKPYSMEILSRSGELISAYLTEDDKWRLHAGISELSSDLINAVMNKEDKWFYWHLGVNPAAVLRAVWQNVLTGRRVSGASTITMQLARLLQPAERNYLNKIIEMIRAIQIELRYSKKEILQMYLSYLPMGGNIEGVKSASYIFFNRPPSKLSLAQSIMLTVIPNDPNAFRIDKPDLKNAKAARNKWIKKFMEEKVFPLEHLKDALEEEIYSKRFSLPEFAPHFARHIKQKHKDHVVRTSLDLKTQLAAEKLLSLHVNRIKNKGITNGAVLVIDNKNNSVAAYCGSADFYDDNSSGQVNGVTALRSPGSALKPFLYAQALNSGAFSPKMKLLDIPTDFAGYFPENYDLKFNGDVTFEFALVNSLNVPAVRLLESTGLNEFLGMLERAGFNDLRKRKNKLGLSVILGGCGVTLEELTCFFTVFANNGLHHKINFLADENSDAGIKIFYPETVFIISEILSNNERPDFPNILSQSTKLPTIAWKTGTSYGKRDAWAVGYNKNYTVGVWTGNFDGKGSPHLSGAEAALPLLFDIFNSIDYNPDQKWFEKPLGLSKRMVCKDTGLLPSELCDNIIEDYFIGNITINKVCDLSKEIYTDIKGQIEYCTECLPFNGYKKRTVKSFAPELEHWFEENGLFFEEYPYHNPECRAKYSEGIPVFVSPVKGYEYYIEKNSEQQIKLQAVSAASVKNHYWYLNDKFIGKCGNGGKIFIKPAKGINKIVCIDDKGSEAFIELSVRFY